MTTHQYTLYELNAMVREALEQEMNREYWVMAELSEVRESRGHCYMELIQCADEGVMAGARTIVAKASAKCWRSTWQLLQPHFQRVTGTGLRAGMQVLLCVYPQFHEAYGFSWIVTDINPEFTMGDMARKRQEIIRQLKEEGVFDLQRELTLPLFAQRIAVISSATAAGYGDFCNQLADNEYGYCFHTQLFPAVMQGEQVEQSVIAALNAVFSWSEECGVWSEFDCVVIIRGGGATADLSGFDSLALAENVANFPLPVITGIGHDRDESILDMVAHTRVKTPTAAAAFLINHLHEVDLHLTDMQERIAGSVLHRLESGKAQLDRMAARLTMAVQERLSTAQQRLRLTEAQLPSLLEHRLLRERHRLELLQQRAASLNPDLLLRRGYSITLHNGKAVRDPKQLQPGDTIETRLEKGTLHSVVSS